MKTLKKMMLFCLTVTLIAGVGSAIIVPTPVNASVKIVKKLPNSIAKTWYTSGKKAGFPMTATTKFSNKNFKIIVNAGAQKQTLKFKIDKIIKFSNTKYAIVSKKDGQMTFRLSTKKFAGKKYQVLSVNDSSLDMLFFVNPTQAKASGYNFMKP